jgi:hypothetical protein
MSLQSSKLGRTLGALAAEGAIAGEINSEQTISAGAAQPHQAVAAPRRPCLPGSMRCRPVHRDGGNAE